MMGLSLWHLLLLLLVIVLLFGRGKISELMGDFAKGIKSFRKGMSDDPDVQEPRATPRTLDQPTPAPTPPGERSKTTDV